MAIDDDDQRQAERIARGETSWYYMVKDVELCPGEFDSTIDKKKENDAVVASQSSHSESVKISKKVQSIFLTKFSIIFFYCYVFLFLGHSQSSGRGAKSHRRGRGKRNH